MHVHEIVQCVCRLVTALFLAVVLVPAEQTLGGQFESILVDFWAVNGMDDFGEHVVIYKNRPVLWAAQIGLRTNVLPEGVRLEAISGDGQTVAGSSMSGVSLWAVTDGEPELVRELGYPPGLNESNAEYFDIQLSYTARQATLRVTDAYDEGPGPFRWTADTGFVALPEFNGYPTPPISGDGTVMVGERSPGTIRVTAEIDSVGQETFSVATVPCPESNVFCTAEAISTDGAAFVGHTWTFSDGYTHREATKWNDNTGIVSLLGTVDGYIHSYATDTSARGYVVVGTVEDMFNNTRAFIWTQHNGMRLLEQMPAADSQLGKQLEGWTLLEGNTVSADGTVIAGSGLNPDGELAAWRLTIQPGDANYDFSVDNQDLAIWFDHRFMENDNFSDGDFNGDGVVDVSDFNIWNVNRTPVGQPNAVPEPASGTLLLLGLLAACRRIRRRRA